MGAERCGAHNARRVNATGPSTEHLTIFVMQELPYRATKGFRHGDDERLAPGSMKDWVEAQTTAGNYSNARDYVRDLIRRDQERAETLSSLQRALDEGFESGISDRSMDQILDAARKEARATRRP